VINIVIVATLYIIQIAFPPLSYWGAFPYLVIVIFFTRKALRIAKHIYLIRDEAYTRISKNFDEEFRKTILKIQREI